MESYILVETLPIINYSQYTIALAFVVCRICIVCILAWSRNLHLWAAASGYCCSECKLELILRKWSCIIWPKGSRGPICSYRTKRDCGMFFAAQLTTWSDLRDKHHQITLHPQCTFKKFLRWLWLKKKILLLKCRSGFLQTTHVLTGWGKETQFKPYWWVSM